MRKGEGFRAFFGGLLSNAVWESIKTAIGGGFMSSLIVGAFSLFRHRSIDWWGLLALALVTAVMWFFLLRSKTSPAKAIASEDVVRQVNLSNDEQVRALNAAHQEEMRKQEAADKAELWRAQESRRICDEERRMAIDRVRELEDAMAPLSPLKMEALKFRRRLQRFIDETGPEPVCDAPQSQNDLENDIAASTVAGLNWNSKMSSFRAILRSSYQVQLHADAEMIYHKFVQARIIDQHFGALLDAPETVERLKELDWVLWMKIGLLE